MTELKNVKFTKGIVIKNRNKNSVTVLVSRLKTNSTYRKKYKISKKYIVYCRSKIEIGKEVKIIETRPMSKTKRHKVLED